MEFNYLEVVKALKREFANGTVKFRADNNRPYIPNQVYTDRVEAATNSRWDKEIKELEINVPQRYVKALVRITIGPQFRDGYGFAEIEGDPEKAMKTANAVDRAVNEAVLEALDTYEMGWKDLAPYKQNDWAGNPALRHLLSESPPDQSSGKPIQSFSLTEHRCIFSNCGSTLTQEEWNLLGKVPNLNLDKMIYCFEHLPAHLKRKLPDETLILFEKKWNKKNKT